jgi:hypothetical protein
MPYGCWEKGFDARKSAWCGIDAVHLAALIGMPIACDWRSSAWSLIGTHRSFQWKT